MAGSPTGRRVPPGTEPANARTAVWLRMALATLALVGFSLAAWALAAAADRPGGNNDGEAAAALLCALIAATAVVDLVLLGVRRARGDYRNN